MVVAGLESWFKVTAEILKRVVRAIASGSQSDLDRLAGKIVE